MAQCLVGILPLPMVALWLPVVVLLQSTLPILLPCSLFKFFSKSRTILHCSITLMAVSSPVEAAESIFHPARSQFGKSEEVPSDTSSSWLSHSFFRKKVYTFKRRSSGAEGQAPSPNGDFGPQKCGLKPQSMLHCLVTGSCSSFPLPVVIPPLYLHLMGFLQLSHRLDQ